MKLHLIGCVLLSVMMSTYVLANKIYSWVDDKGVTHYGENPPKNTPSRVVNAKTGHSDPVNYESGEKSEPKAKSATDTAAANEERCATARKNLQMLQSNARIKTTDKNGENRFMNPEEMQAQVATMEAIIADECSGK